MDPWQRLTDLRVLRPLVRLRYDRRFTNNRHEQLFRGVFSSMAAAAQSAPTTRPTGYDNPEAAQMYGDLREEVALADYPMIHWLARLSNDVRRVFDYGGHVGVKFYAYAPFLRLTAETVWTVCDVPRVTEAGRALAAQRSEPRLRFATDFASSIEDQDLLICSGSLQYIEPTLAEQLTRVMRRPPHILLNTTPFHEGPTFYTLNSIGTAFCPYKIQNVGEFLEGLSRLGYELVHRWKIPGKTTHIPFHPEQSRYEYLGMYLTKRS